LELLIIRHGQSEADLLGVHEGRADFPLTELGERQARKMAEYVATHYPPDMIISSPLKRANKTASLLQLETGCDLVVEPELMEFNNGVLAGLSKEVAATCYPIPKDGRPIHIPIQDGESELEFRQRVERVFHKIIFDYQQYNRVAIVSHGGTISNLLKVFLKQSFNTEFAFPTGDTGIHLIEIKKHQRVVRFLNRLEHLQTYKQ
jgi:2,3-bisphosphoglycerate-dependent phosphoglycerate mutase